MAYPHKSRRIAEVIASWFEKERYRPGDRFPSDQELAREFGVNHVTVRTALKQFVEAGWLERRVGAGTVVRDPKKRTVKPTVVSGLALAIPDVTHSFFSELLRAVEGALLPTGRPLLLGHTWELAQREEQVVNTWLGLGISHMVLTPPAIDPRFYQTLIERGVRLVFVDRRVEGVDVPSIVSRDDAGMASVVKYLVGLGHQRMVHLAGPSTIWTARQRRESFERSALEAGFGRDNVTVKTAGFYIEDGYAATNAALEEKGVPDAIIACNDPVAVGAIRALQERGLRVPEDVTVTGYGDTDLGRNFDITTVRQFPDRMGREAARLVLDTAPISDKDSVEIEPELVVRTSTAMPGRRLRAALQVESAP